MLSSWVNVVKVKWNLKRVHKVVCQVLFLFEMLFNRDTATQHPITLQLTATQHPITLQLTATQHPITLQLFVVDKRLSGSAPTWQGSVYRRTREAEGVDGGGSVCDVKKWDVVDGRLTVDRILSTWWRWRRQARHTADRPDHEWYHWTSWPLDTKLSKLSSESAKDAYLPRRLDDVCGTIDLWLKHRRPTHVTHIAMVLTD